MSIHVVVMGVAGCGKSTVAEAIRDRLSYEMAEGDAFHPQANIDKMSAGIPSPTKTAGPGCASSTHGWQPRKPSTRTRSSPVPRSSAHTAMFYAKTYPYSSYTSPAAMNSSKNASPHAKGTSCPPHCSPANSLFWNRLSLMSQESKSRSKDRSKTWWTAQYKRLSNMPRPRNAHSPQPPPELLQRHRRTVTDILTPVLAKQFASQFSIQRRI